MAQVQCVAAGSASAGTTIQVNISSSGSGNDLVFMFWVNAGLAVTEVTDSALQSYTVRQNTGYWFVYDKLDSASGVSYVRATVDTSCGWIACVVERDDLASFDKTAYQEQGTTTSFTSTATATTTSNDEYCFGMAATFSGGPINYAASGSWSALVAPTLTSGSIQNSSPDTAFFEGQTLSATGTPAATGTCASSYQYVAIVTYALDTAGQTSAPTSDITSGWTPSTGATLYGTIDEASPGTDTDYDYTSTAATMEVKFAAVTDPSTAYQHQVKYRLAGASTGNLVVSLRQGSSQIASWTHTPPATATTYTGTLTSAEAESITDYGDLRLRVVSST